MAKIKPILARHNDADLAPRFPYGVEIGYEHTYLSNLYEEYRLEALNPDIVIWLRANVGPRTKWQFCCYSGVLQLYLDPITGEEFESIGEKFRVRFAREKDAFNFKMRWYGAAP